ncbi:MAG: response regulator [Desulfovibrio sp.]|jgi:DNA-binding NtrC family response regulator|nr:response regulator [Desulfovibrio sp.]
MSKKILVVDDESHIRSLYQEELQAAGYEVALSDGREAIMQLIEREKPNIVVLDIKLGGTVTGLDLLQTIRGTNTTLPVILSSAFESFQNDLKAIAADAYCVKSIDLTNLKETILSVLAKEKS